MSAADTDTSSVGHTDSLDVHEPAITHSDSSVTTDGGAERKDSIAELANPAVIQEVEESELSLDDGKKAMLAADEEIEPRLKYTKITQLPPSVFRKDLVSAVLVGDTFFAFATHGGVVHLLNPDFSLIRSYRAHQASVLGLATDGTYLGSASIDGTVVIASVKDSADVTASDFKRPVHSVALDPNYKSTKAFISGGMAGDVILSERGWLGKRADTILQTSEDPVIAVYWLEGLIIWMNDSGINIYSQFTKQLLLNIPRPKESPRSDLYKPRICTPESNRIYIAWADRVWNLKITVTKTKDTRNILSSGASMVFSSASSVRSTTIEQSISVESDLHVDCLVAGIAAFKEDSIMLLRYLPPPEPSEGMRHTFAPNPQLCLVDLETGTLNYSDELELDGYERLGLNDYHLCQYADSTTTKFLIVSAKDGVVAMERDLGDRVTWLLERKKFKEAWEFSANFKLPVERHAIGIDWVESLVEDGYWREAVKTLDLVQRTLLDTDVKPDPILLDSTTVELSAIEIIVRDNWNHWGWLISRAGFSDWLAPFLPLDPKLGVERQLYEFILTRFIDEDNLNELLSYLKKWVVDLYDFALIKRYIEDLLQDNPPAEEHLRRTLADLYVASGDPVSAVHHLIVLRDTSVLDLVSRNHLLSKLLPQIPDLLIISFSSVEELNLAPLSIAKERLARAIHIVVRARNEVSAKAVLKEIMNRKNMDVVAFLYLEHLHAIEPYESYQFGDLQARLYAQFDRPKLLKFLKKNRNYNYEAMVEVCESYSYIPELVFILGKIGQNKRALRLIIEELDDPEQAIEFAKQQHDRELWDDLLDRCMSRPDFIKAVLEKASGAIPPASIIARIPLHMEIPGLKATVSKIFAEHELVLSINKGILEIVHQEAQFYANHLRAERTKGLALNFLELNSRSVQRTESGSSEKAGEKQPGLDLLSTVVVLPDGTVVSEPELVGEENVWSQKGMVGATGVSTYATRSVAQKVKHLAYIKKQLQLHLK